MEPKKKILFDLNEPPQEPRKKIFFDLNETPQVPRILDANEPEPPENMSIEKQQLIMKFLSIFIPCCNCKFFVFLFFFENF